MRSAMFAYRLSIAARTLGVGERIRQLLVLRADEVVK